MTRGGHPFDVRLQVTADIVEHALARLKSSQLQIGVQPCGIDAENLAAECDGGVEESEVAVPDDGLLPGLASSRVVA